MAKAKAESLGDEVLRRAVESRPGPTAWCDDLPADMREELDRVRDLYRQGQVSVRKYSIGRAIRNSLLERGLRAPNVAGVVRWLDQDPR